MNTRTLLNFLIENGSYSRKKESERTQLEYAIRYGFVDIVEKYLKQGGDPNDKDVLGKTPYDKAKELYREEMEDEYCDDEKVGNLRKIMPTLIRHGAIANKDDNDVKNEYVHEEDDNEEDDDNDENWLADDDNDEYWLNDNDHNENTDDEDDYKDEGYDEDYDKSGISSELQAVIGVKRATRMEVFHGIWAYIRENNLQDPENKQYFCPDDKLAKIFGTERIRNFGMTKYFSAHMYQRQ